MAFNYFVPMMNRQITDETREIYLSQIKAGKVERVFLTCGGYSMMTDEERSNNVEVLKS